MSRGELGYPGVVGNPNERPETEHQVSGKVLGRDAVNSLIKTENGDIVVVDNKKVKGS